jgi:glycosyltransferase involved in cell wall biosynthesis
MTSPNFTLSIAIPTFNRCEYLRELLPKIISQCNHIDTASRDIELVICDNASTDQTSEYIRSLNPDNSRISYYRNNRNIGGDANFINCVNLAKGKYVWLFGDDELLKDHGISDVIRILKKYDCSLLLVKDDNYAEGLIQSELFLNYKALVNRVAKINPHFVLAHTLITSNIFKKEAFDIRCAYHCISTNYGHMYGLMNKLKCGGAVYFFNEPIIIVREQRAEFAKHPKYLILKQTRYIRFIGMTFENKDIIKYSYVFLFKNYFQIFHSFVIMICIRLPKKIINTLRKIFKL